MRSGRLRPPGAGQGARLEPASPASLRPCPMAAPEARGFREVPTAALTPGAGLESEGLVDLEEEEEEEEAAAARRARSFVQDARVRLLGGRLEQMLGLPADKWSQHLESEDHRQVLGEFLEGPSPARLVFSIAAGRLSASREVRDHGRGEPTTLHAQHNGYRAAGGGTGRSVAHSFWHFRNFEVPALESAESSRCFHSVVRRLEVSFLKGQLLSLLRPDKAGKATFLSAAWALGPRWFLCQITSV